MANNKNNKNNNNNNNNNNNILRRFNYYYSFSLLVDMILPILLFAFLVFSAGKGFSFQIPRIIRPIPQAKVFCVSDKGSFQNRRKCRASRCRGSTKDTDFELFIASKENIVLKDNIALLKDNIASKDKIIESKDTIIAMQVWVFF
jgi:hypothetical protein